MNRKLNWCCPLIFLEGEGELALSYKSANTIYHFICSRTLHTLRRTYPRGYVLISTKDWSRKIIKPEQRSNLYHPITGRIFCQLNYPIFSLVKMNDCISEHLSTAYVYSKTMPSGLCDVMCVVLWSKSDEVVYLLSQSQVMCVSVRYLVSSLPM